ncbi:MAG: hypothetical protein ACU0BF_05255 [Paracoccaceae bacterium]
MDGDGDRRRRPWAAALVSALVALIAGPPVALAMALILVVDRQIAAPSHVVAAVAERAREGLGDGRLEVGRLSLTVARDLHPRVRLHDVTLRDGPGREVAQATSLDLLASPRALARGRVLLQRLELSGTRLSLRRARDGRIEARFGGGPARAAGLAEVMVGLRGAFERPALAGFETLIARDVVVNYEDARAGRIWTVDGGRIEAARAGGALTATADLSVLSGRAEAARLIVGYEGAGAGASVTVEARAVSAADLGTQAPALAWLTALDAPLDASLGAAFDAGGALTTLDALLIARPGTIRPGGAAAPVPFDRFAADLSFDAARGRIEVAGAEYIGTGGSGALRGHVDVVGGAYVAQLSARDLTVRSGARAPVAVPTANVAARLRLRPFRLEIGRGSLTLPGVTAPVALSGRIETGPEGWTVALDASARAVAIDPALAAWPDWLRPGLRGWLGANVRGGRIEALTAAWRSDAAPRLRMSARVTGTRVRPLADWPFADGVAGTLMLGAEGAVVTADAGTLDGGAGPVAIAGSSMRIAGQPARAQVTLRARSEAAAALSLLARPPLRVPAPGGGDPGRAIVDAAGDVAFDLRPGLRAPDFDWSARARLTQVDLPRLIPGQRLTSREVTMRASPERLIVEGRGELSGVPFDGRYERPLGRPGPATVTGTAQLSAEGLARLGAGLPDGLMTGSARARIDMTLPPGEAPQLRATSDVRGAAIAVPGVGARKAAGVVGDLTVEAVLGEAPRIDALTLSFPGFSLRGDLSPAGGGADLDFDRLRAGGWLDVAGTLRARPGAATSVRIAGGSVDLRARPTGGGGGGRATGPAPRIEARLDEVRATDAIALTGVTAELSGEAGAFAGRINGGVAVEGTLAPGGRIDLRAADAGAALASAGLTDRVAGGSLSLVLRAREGGLDGRARLRDLRVSRVPALAALVDAVSVIGLLRQMDGRGLAFDAVEASVRLRDGVIALDEGSAVGASLGLALRGLYDTRSGQMDMAGSISPVYALNRAGGARAGEGLVSFPFRLTGTPAAPNLSMTRRTPEG